MLGVVRENVVREHVWLQQAFERPSTVHPRRPKCLEGGRIARFDDVPSWRLLSGAALMRQGRLRLGSMPTSPVLSKVRSAGEPHFVRAGITCVSINHSIPEGSAARTDQQS